MIDADLLNNLVKDEIRKIRTADTGNKMSQKEMGDIMKLSRSAVANLETGKQRVSLHNIYSLCEHWDLDLSVLLPSIADVTGEKYSENGYTQATKSMIEKLREEK